MDGGELLFTVARSEVMERRLHWLLAAVLAALTTIVALAYPFIRHIFKPLRGLREGMDAGNLTHRVPTSGAQEFRDLAEAFNDMTTRVHLALQSKEQLLLDVSHELRSPITRMKLIIA